MLHSDWCCTYICTGLQKFDMLESPDPASARGLASWSPQHASNNNNINAGKLRLIIACWTWSWHTYITKHTYTITKHTNRPICIFILFLTCNFHRENMRSISQTKKRNTLRPGQVDSEFIVRDTCGERSFFITWNNVLYVAASRIKLARYKIQSHVF